MTGRAVSTLVLFGALLGGCGDEAPPVAAPRAATPGCAELADEMIAQVQVVVDELGAATLDDLERDDLIGRRTQERLDEVDARAAEAGCSDEEIDFLMAERADRIRGDGVVAEAVREALGQYEGLPFSTEG